MITNDNLDKIYSYKIGDVVNKNIIYFLNKECAFFYIDYEYFEGTYNMIDKLYYINFFREHNIIYSGMHKSWYTNGILKEQFFHIDGDIII